MSADKETLEVIYERKEKSVRKIQSEEEDKGGGPNKEMENCEKNMKKDNMKEEGKMNKGDKKEENEAKRKEAIEKKNVNKNDEKKIKDEDHLQREKSCINDINKTEKEGNGNTGGEKGHTNIKKEEGEELEKSTRAEDIKDNINFENGQKDKKNTGYIGISEKRLEETEARETTSHSLKRASLQRVSLSDDLDFEPVSVQSDINEQIVVGQTENTPEKVDQQSSNFKEDSIKVSILF